MELYGLNLGQWGPTWGTGLAKAASEVDVGRWVGLVGWLWLVVSVGLVGVRPLGGLCVDGRWLLVSWVSGAFGAAFWDFVWFEGVVGGHFHSG